MTLRSLCHYFLRMPSGQGINLLIIHWLTVFILCIINLLSSNTRLFMYEILYPWFCYMTTTLLRPKNVLFLDFFRKICKIWDHRQRPYPPPPGPEIPDPPLWVTTHKDYYRAYSSHWRNTIKHVYYCGSRGALGKPSLGPISLIFIHFRQNFC